MSFFNRDDVRWIETSYDYSIDIDFFEKINHSATMNEQQDEIFEICKFSTASQSSI